MNNLFRLIFKHDSRISALYLVSIWLLLAHPASAVDIQCDLAENSRIKPAITMHETTIEKEIAV